MSAVMPCLADLECAALARELDVFLLPEEFSMPIQEGFLVRVDNEHGDVEVWSTGRPLAGSGENFVMINTGAVTIDFRPTDARLLARALEIIGLESECIPIDVEDRGSVARRATLMVTRLDLGKELVIYVQRSPFSMRLDPQACLDLAKALKGALDYLNDYTWRGAGATA